MRRFPFAVALFPAAALAGLWLLPAAPAQPPAADVSLKVVKYADLTAATRAQVGKVVVVDIWADFCVECKKELPRLVELQRRLADKGLVCVTVNVDSYDAASHDKALKFLQKINASLTNYQLDEDQKVWTAKLDAGALPVVFVFDRKGRRVAKFPDAADKPFNYVNDIGPLVEKLVAER